MLFRSTKRGRGKTQGTTDLLVSVPRKIMENIVPGSIERHLKNNAIIRHKAGERAVRKVL